MNKFIQNYVKKEKKIIPVLKLASIYGMHDDGDNKDSIDDDDDSEGVIIIINKECAAVYYCCNR